MADTQEKLNLEDNCMGQSLGVYPRVQLMRDKSCILVRLMPTFSSLLSHCCPPSHLTRPFLMFRRFGFGFQCIDFTRTFCITMGFEPSTESGLMNGYTAEDNDCPFPSTH